MGVAHTLFRTFFWSENILATVFLSGKDSIINAPLVRAYLQAGVGEGQQNGKYTSSRSESSEANPADKINGRLNVVWCADLDHGQIFDLAVWRVRLENEVLKQARAGKSSIDRRGDARMANSDRSKQESRQSLAS
jgi:hypothetical protein